jgi:xanthine dehydrogenase accessory factor
MIWQAALEAVEADLPALLTLVVANTRRSPGTRGAALLVAPGRAPVGTIGGGAMERALLQRAPALWARGPGHFELRALHHRRQPQGEPSGLICAGRQTNLSLVLGPGDAPALRAACALLAQDRPGQLTWSPQQPLAVAAAPLDVAGEPVAVEDHPDGPRLRVSLFERRRVAIFGAGHCGRALARQMSWLGYVVTLLDDRLAILDEARAPYIRHALAVEDLSLAAAQVSAPALTAAVVMTTDLRSDVQALRGALAAPFPFLGLMGAPAKRKEIFTELSGAGFGEAALGRIVAPVGLPIGSATPEEIAVSVAAQLVSLRQRAEEAA